MARKRLIVVGGDAAGMSAASQLRRLDRDREIVVFEKGPHTSYAACGIPYFVAGLIEKPEQLIARTPETFREKYDIDARTLQEVMAVDCRGKTVQITDHREGRSYSMEFDDLLIATGALPFKPDVPGIDSDGVFGVNTLESGIALERFLRERRPTRAIVVGGGYIGLEIAEALNCHRGLKVTLVERAPQVMGTLDPDMGALVGDAISDVGIDLRLGETLQAVETAGGKIRAVVTDKGEIETDLVVLGLGVRPNTALAAEAGLALGVRDAIRVDDRMATPTPSVWAAGDCAETFHLVSRQPFHVALGTVANKMGRVAGINLAGKSARFPGVVGTAVSKICKYEVARTGLLEAEAKKLDLDYSAATIKTRTRAGYYPGAGRIHVKLLAENGTGRLLGGQIVGVEGAAKRIDVLAACLHGQKTVQDLVDMDLSYAPPFSPVWDPVQIAARALLKEV
ncbi:MAG: FAD-dependent oxidoreductase [Synergistaceae bacterium]|nr:FAD-dependent oxidoreductase [Synergistaceae bacterium]